MRLLICFALVCAPMLYAQSGQGPRHPVEAPLQQDDPVRLPAPKKGQEHIANGEEAFGEGRMEDAVKHFTNAIEAQPENDEVYAYRAAAYVALRKLDDADADLKIAVDLDSTFSLTWNTRGYVQWRRGNFANAIEDYTAALAYAADDRRVDDGGRAQMHQNRGIAWQDLGNTDRALLDFNICIELLPDYAAFLENRGLIYVEKRLFDMAFADFDYAVELEPKNARAYVNRAFAAREMGDYEQAVRDYSQALRIQPDYGQALIGRGHAWLAWRQFEPARKDFEAALEVDESEAPGYLGLAKLKRLAGELEEALYLVEAALIANPDYHHAIYMKVNLHLELDGLEDARYYAERLCKLAPDVSAYWKLSGKIMIRFEGWEYALDSLNRAIELAPNDLETRTMRLRCFAKLTLFSAANGEARAIHDIDRAAGFVSFARVDLLRDSDDISKITALEYLNMAKDLGESLAYLADDPDFAVLKDDPEFKKLVGND